MNQLLNPQSAASLTMSTREIAVLVSKRHDHVLRTARHLSAQGVTQSVETLYLHDQNGQRYPEHQLTKRDSLVLVARLSPEFTARVIDRWQELERSAVPAANLPDFNNPAEMARIWADQYEQSQKQQAELEEARPAVEFVERYVEARSSKSLREVAKVLGIREREFIGRMLDERILFRQSGSLLPAASFHHKGYFTVKTGESNGHAYQQTRFTPEGIAWISKRFGLIGQEVSQ